MIDTQAWFWWITGSAKLRRDAARSINQASRIFVPSIVCYEILVIEDLQRIKFDRPPLQWLREALARPRTEIAELSPEIAAQAVAFRRTTGGDPFDHVVAAMAVVLKLPLVTSDERIASLPGIRAIW